MKKTLLITAPAGGATEALQQALQNFNAKYLSGYDSERRLDDEIIRSFIVGMVVDASVSAGGQALGGALRKDRRSANSPEDGQRFDPEKTE